MAGNGKESDPVHALVVLAGKAVDALFGNVALVVTGTTIGPDRTQPGRGGHPRAALVVEFRSSVKRTGRLERPARVLLVLLRLIR
jgi:hypothetical protein